MINRILQLVIHVISQIQGFFFFFFFWTSLLRQNATHPGCVRAPALSRAHYRACCAPVTRTVARAGRLSCTVKCAGRLSRTISLRTSSSLATQSSLSRQEFSLPWLNMSRHRLALSRHTFPCLGQPCRDMKYYVTIRGLLPLVRTLSRPLNFVPTEQL